MQTQQLGLWSLHILYCVPRYFVGWHDFQVSLCVEAKCRKMLVLYFVFVRPQQAIFNYISRSTQETNVFHSLGDQRVTITWAVPLQQRRATFLLFCQNSEGLLVKRKLDFSSGFFYLILRLCWPPRARSQGFYRPRWQAGHFLLLTDFVDARWCHSV